MKKSLAVMLALIMVLCMIPTTALAANGTGHQISVKIYKVVLDSSKPLGYQNPEFVKTITVICQDGTGHSGYNHFVNLKEFHPTKVGLSTTDWTGWQFNGYYNKGNDQKPFYDWTKDRVNATANVTGSEPYPCSKNFYLVYKEAAPQTQDITLTYNANGGSGAPGPETKKVEIGKSATFTVSATEPTRENYTFKGWSTNKNATTAEFIGGNSITISQNTTLYAVWEENNPTPPTTDKPEPPKPENTPGIPGLTGAEVVNVKCTTNSSHAKKSYPLIADSYDVGNVEGDATSGYTCTITVKPGEYVKAYNGTYLGHTLVEPENHTINLKWNENKWKVDSGVPVVFDVKCETTQPENPAELTSFVKSRVTVTPDNMSTLPEGVTFNTDSTVTFNDNSTTANLLYSFTVKGTPGAEVVIKDDRATFIDNGKSEITVTLPAAVENETETSTTVYGYRTFSVDDIQNGKLVNNATANVKGDDNNKKEAKAEVDAKDNRTLDNTLTVKKLVSGNAANPTEKFPFKATFTFPVPVASANLDGVTPVEKVEIIFELANGQTRTFSYTSDSELKTKIDNWMKENTAYWSLTGDAVFAMLSYKVEETNAKGYTLATNGDAEGKADGHKAVTFTNTKNKPNDDHGGHYHPTTTPVPVIVIPPKTGDMTIWQSILHFLGIR